MGIYRGFGGTGDSSSNTALSEVAALGQEVLAAQAVVSVLVTEAEAAQAAAEAAQAAAETAQTAAELAETNAELAETNAETAETNAETAQAAAEAAQAAAEASETAAAASASSASSSASAAATSASNAATSASNASTSASSAATAQAAAEAAQAAAEDVFTQFGDQYLGPFASDPTLDNSGNALTTGDIYFNTTNNVLKFYSGAAWVAPESVATTAATAASTSASNAATSEANAAASAAAAATFDPDLFVAKSGATMTGPLTLPDQMALKATASVRPSIRPSLLLDFANTEQLDPRITFTRASEGRFYGTQTAKAEENLLTFSQAFAASGTPWVGLNTTGTENSTTAPDGTSTADKLIATATSGNHRVRQTIGAAGTYVFSVFAKAAEYTRVALGDGGTTNVAVFDLSAGTVTPSGTVSNASITAVADGFYRCVVTVTVTTSGPHIWMVDNSSNFTFTGNGTNGVILWGAQLEQRDAVTAYTPTTTQPITNYIPVLETAAAGVARFDHNPVTGESLGLLIEEQRTNLLVRSEEFQTTWSIVGTASVVTNTVVAPDGALTADKLVLGDTIASAAVALNQSATKPATSAPYTASVYIRAGEFNSLRLILRDAASSSNFVQAYFNAATGVIAQAANAGGTFTAASATITAVGNGWYRCSVTGTTSTETSLNVRIMNYQDGTGSATGNGYSGIYIWGAQLEAGAFPTSYIPTVASQVTRSADAASMTGANFSSWYRQDEGSLYAEWQKFAPSSFQGVFSIAGVGANNFFLGHSSVANNNNSLRFDVAANGVAQASLVTAVNSLSNTFYKTAAAYAVDNLAAVSNAGSVGTDTSVALPVVNRAFIGAGTTGTNGFLNGTIKKLAYYPKRLSNTEIQSLTS